jgi:hypothetical protein
MTKARNTTDYLTDLDKWQAYNHHELANTKPEELFQEPFVERYKNLHSNLWWRVIRVHGTLFTIGQLIEFPFDCIYAPTEMEFWRLVIWNFVDASILLLHGLAIDTGRKVHSLQSFRNEIIKAAWLRSDKLERFKQTLRERKFSETVKSIAERVNQVRDSHIAHRLMDKQSGLAEEGLADVSIEELWDLFDAVHSLFGALSFGAAYITLVGDLTPSTVGGEPTRTCLDGVLDAVLRDNYLVNEPERKPKLWPIYRKHRNPEELRVLNELRNRIGLPEA